MRRLAAAQRGEEAEYDYVVLEIKAALAQAPDCTIIPVLIDGAGVPREQDLPDEIKALPKRHVFKLRSAQWEDEIQRLASRLREIINHRRRLPWLSWVAAVAMLLLAVVGVSYFVLPLPFWPPSLVAGQSSTPVAAVEARIVEPADGSNVPGEVTAKGIARNIPPGQTVWTVVSNGTQFWPQRPVLRVANDWTCPVGFGGGAIGLDGKKFDLLIVTADAEANKAWLDWIAEGERTGNYPGLNILPPGVTNLQKVTVTLKVT